MAEPGYDKKKDLAAPETERQANVPAAAYEMPPSPALLSNDAWQSAYESDYALFTEHMKYYLGLGYRDLDWNGSGIEDKTKLWEQVIYDTLERHAADKEKGAKATFLDDRLDMTYGVPIILPSGMEYPGTYKVSSRLNSTLLGTDRGVVYDTQKYLVEGQMVITCEYRGIQTSVTLVLPNQLIMVNIYPLVGANAEHKSNMYWKELATE